MASYIRYDGPVRMSVIVPRVGVLYRALLGERPSSAATGALGDFFSLRDDGEHEVPSARLATGHTKHTNVTPSSPLPFTSLVRQIAVSFDYPRLFSNVSRQSGAHVWSVPLLESSYTFSRGKNC